ncbi:hypothetical protein HG535_0G02610 [Zygotorulaspora mrakii]|uniref:Transcriptional protein SWT1 n=1 Tax=Zygotorulaspora mrakii TaxID=42260 RepID=A0A7H9B6M0_ZYGMR|nr:uncharacterized protein HG535_0G02610 [Zygotorulaspora mrakii]QLG74378.1 hypothetical protein HG535_0G02610 [Zygotorulaspora mrakii]
MRLPSLYASGNDKVDDRGAKIPSELTVAEKAYDIPSHAKKHSRSCSSSGSCNGGGSGSNKYTVADIDKIIANGKSRTAHHNFTGTVFDEESSPHDLCPAQRRTSPLPAELSEKSTMEPTILVTTFVLDTNFMISHLEILETLRILSSQYHHRIVIPLTVIQELDGLKGSSKTVEDISSEKNGETIGSLARWANDWLYRNLANLDSSVIGQKLRESIDKDCVKDNSILDCCLYFQGNSDSFVILLSNDKNLCLKALKEGIPTVSYREGMSPQLIASMSYTENVNRYGLGSSSRSEDISMDSTAVQDCQRKHSGMNFIEVSTQIFREITPAVTDAIDFIMISEYGNELELVDYIPNSLISLHDVSKCIAKYWISIFADYFIKSPLKQNSWKTLNPNLVDIPRNYPSLSNFKMFWTDVLYNLFSKRSDDDNTRLQLLIDRWNNLTQLCEHAK